MSPSLTCLSRYPPRTRSCAGLTARSGNRTIRGFLRGLAVDVSMLGESRDLRLLFSGLAISVVGRQITLVAVSYQVYIVTHSSLAVGLLGLVQLIPFVLVSLYSGALADTLDRRRLLLVSQALLALTSLGLAFGAVGLRAPIWSIYMVTAFAAAFSAIETPTRQATIARLVSRPKLAATMSLTQVIWQFGQVAGPAAAGLVIARLGLVFAYSIDVATYAACLLAVAAMSPQRSGGRVQRIGWRAPLSGLAYVGRRPLLLSILAADLDAMVFGLPRAVFPALAATTFAVGPTGLGLLYASPAAGALAGSLLTGWVTRIRRQGRLVVWAIIVWGAAITAFGLGPPFAIALLFLAVAGAADMLSAVFRNSILQLTTEEAFRGRVTSLYVMVTNGGPRLGDLETGLVASWVTPQFAVVSGGLACLVGIGVLVALVPVLRNYRYDPAAEGPKV